MNRDKELSMDILRTSNDCIRVNLHRIERLTKRNKLAKIPSIELSNKWHWSMIKKYSLDFA